MYIRVVKVGRMLWPRLCTSSRGTAERDFNPSLTFLKAFLPALNSAKWQKQLRKVSSDARVWLGDLCDLEGGSAEREIARANIR